jgi:hypothetical protein
VGKARPVIAVEEEPLEEVPGYDGHHALTSSTTAAAAASALALAAGASVVGGAAALPEAAAAEAVATRYATAALLGRGQCHRRQDGGQNGCHTQASQC